MIAAVRGRVGDALGSMVFFGLMAVGSGISLVRGFVIAAILQPSEFGIYVTVVAVGTFASNLLSFGQVEATMKEYPRLWSTGERALVVRKAAAVASILTRRAVIAAMTVVLIAAALGRSDLLAQLGLGAAVALGVAASSLYASAQRATFDLKHLGAVTVFRAAVSLVLACVGAWLGSWPGALLGEIVAAVLSVVVSKMFLVRAAARGEPMTLSADSQSAGRDHGGVWLFVALLVGATPVYLDRLFVSAAFSNIQLGTYGFVMLFVSGATAIVGIVTQKLGPRLIYEERRGVDVLSHIKLALGWSAGFAVLAAGGMGVVGWALLAGPAVDLGTRYALDTSLLVLVFLLCCSQCSTLLDWVLLSRDRERKVFASSMSFMLGACGVALITPLMSLSLTEFIVGMCCAKLMQILTQAFFIGAVLHERRTVSSR